MRTLNRRSFIKNGVAAGLVLTASGFTPRRTYSAEIKKFNRVVYRDLGSTGFRVSEIGFGVLHIQDTALIHTAIDAGINFFDTAHSYMNGVCEKTLGEVMKTRRAEVFLTTKISSSSPKSMKKQISISLKRLQTDHVDLLLLHGASKKKMLNDDIIKVFDIARKKGTTRFIGVSTHDHGEVPDIAAKSGFWEALLIPYNYFSPRSVADSIKKAREAGLAVIGMKNLITIPTPRKPYPDIRKDKTRKTTNQQALLKWALQNPYIDTVIPGISSFEHIVDDIAVMGMKLTLNDLQMIRHHCEGTKGHYCRGIAGCSGCSGKCPKGLEIKEINRCLNYADVYECIDLAHEEYSKLHPSNRVDICADCAECIVKCINGINLTKNIKRARSIFA